MLPCGDRVKFGARGRVTVSRGKCKLHESNLKDV